MRRELPLEKITCKRIISRLNKLIKGHMHHIDAEAGASPFRKKCKRIMFNAIIPFKTNIPRMHCVQINHIA
jgi:hypothetical protein